MAWRIYWRDAGDRKLVPKSRREKVASGAPDLTVEMERVSHSGATEGIVLSPPSFLTRAVEWKVMPFNGTQNTRGG